MKVTEKDKIKNDDKNAKQITESKGNHIRPGDVQTERVQFDCFLFVYLWKQ